MRPLEFSFTFQETAKEAKGIYGIALFFQNERILNLDIKYGHLIQQTQGENSRECKQPVTLP